MKLVLRSVAGDIPDDELPEKRKYILRCVCVCVSFKEHNQASLHTCAPLQTKTAMSSSPPSLASATDHSSMSSGSNASAMSDAPIPVVNSSSSSTGGGESASVGGSGGSNTAAANTTNSNPSQQQQQQQATTTTSSGGGAASSLDSQIERLSRCEYLRENEVKALCLRAREILVDEGNVQRVDAPVTVRVFVCW